MTGASYRNLLKWKDLPIAEAYVEEKVKEALAGTYNKLISAGPAVADRLLSIAWIRRRSPMPRCLPARR